MANKEGKKQKTGKRETRVKIDNPFRYSFQTNVLTSGCLKLSFIIESTENPEIVL